MRNLGLDICRFAAVMLVLGRHLRQGFEDSLVLELWHRGGWIGVDLFFVLSGFLIGSRLLQEVEVNGKIDVVAFYIKRACKIYPPFWVLLAFTVVVRSMLGQPVSSACVMSELLFIQNYREGVWIHTWSLAVEEHFYLILPCLVLALYRKKALDTRSLLLFFSIIAGFCFCFRWLACVNIKEFSGYYHLFPTHLRIDALLWGVVIARLHQSKHAQGVISSIPVWVLMISGLLLFIPCFIWEIEATRSLVTFGCIANYLGSGLIVCAALRLERARNSVLNTFGFIGSCSYSIYLWHMIPATWGNSLVKRLLGYDYYCNYLAVYFFGALILGVFMFYAIEWQAAKICKIALGKWRCYMHGFK